MLWEALVRIAERKPGDAPQENAYLKNIRRDHYTVEGCIETIREHLKKGPVPFDELFGGSPNRQEAVTLFIALLELLKRGKAYVTQSQTFDRIILHPGRRKPVAAS
jgi:segregation and condensation protein A